MKLAGCLLLFMTVGAVAGCMHESEVNGPDGETSHLISCPDTEDCYAKASEFCPEGYVIRSSDTKPYMTPGSGGGPVLSKTEILVSCKADVAAAQAAQPADPDKRQDTRVCEAAYKYEQDFADYWAGRIPGARRLEELPESRDFIAVCREMPERVQRCLHEHYREAHDKACEAVLSRLDATSRGKVDGMFLEAAPGPVPPPTTPAPAASTLPPATAPQGSHAP